MRLVAIFIENEDLEKGGETINFGGYYSYEFIQAKNKVKLKQEENKNFIEHFFDKDAVITNISAVVGPNGCGKTTLIYDLLEIINDHFFSGIAIWEDENRISYIQRYKYTHPIIPNSDYDIQEYKEKPGTIYYSPYLDNKSTAYGIDISADRYLAEDLAYIDKFTLGDYNINISQHLKRKNQERFIKFQKSKYANAIRDRYGLFDDNLFRVNFTNHNIKASRTKRDLIYEFEIDFHNTPNKFRDFLEQLYSKIKYEYISFNRSVKSEEERLELNKQQMKNKILEAVFSLLVNLMELRNTYLEEGFFISKSEELSKMSAYEMLEYWLNNYDYSKKIGKILPDEEVLNLLSFLFDYIDGPDLSIDLSVINWDSKSIYFEEDKLEKLLKLNDALIYALPKYYRKKKSDNLYGDVSRLQQFLTLEFSRRNLSSGETAMLNLFSRIFDFFDRKILNTQVVQKADYYLLFLDEADMGYHPKWKTSYISSIIEFCKFFFAELGSQVQIIISTHDPLSLSDIPNDNITYLHKSEDQQRRVLSFNDEKRPPLSFAANITDLLENSFFLEEHPIGDFAKKKIDEVIEWINENKESSNGEYNKQELQTIKKIISIIEEPVLRNKLVEMVSEIEVDNVFIEEMIEKETSYLRKLLKRNQ